MTEKVVRKTTAKKVVRRTASKTVPARSVAPKTAVSTVRKAPVREVAPSQKQRRSQKIPIISFVLFVLVMGVSALIGFSDKGQLDVENTIRDRKQNATGAEQAALQAVPTEQSGGGAPNGGLVGMGQSEPEVVVPDATTTIDATASSSEQTASSTPATVTTPKEPAQVENEVAQ